MKCEKPQKIGVVTFPPEQESRPAINLLRYCGVPKKYEGYRLDSYEGNQALVDLLAGHVHTADSVTLIGKTGCGKTHLAVGMLAEFSKKSHDAIFITAPELLLKIRSSFGERASLSEEELIDRYSSCGLLVLDDLGSEKTSEFSITTLYLIIDRRNRSGRKTIITTNLSLEEIEQSLGARISSRLSDSKIVKITTMPDYRKKRGNNGRV